MSLRARLLLAIAYPLVVAIIALAVPLTVNLHDRVEAEVREQASTQASLLAATVPELDAASLRELVRQGGERTGGRVVVTDRTGVVLADSEDAGAIGAGFGARPEIAAALAGRRFQEERSSSTLGTDLLATAVPVVRAGEPDGAVRITQDTRAVADATTRATTGIAAVSGIVLGAGLLLAAVLAAQLARPSRQLQAAAERLAVGDLQARAPETGAKEQRRVAVAFNDMAVRLGRLLDGQRAFVADASHQLRTPLTGMRLRLEEIRHADVPVAVREDADAAIAELDRLSRTVDELLVLSQAGERDAPAERLSLEAVLAETFDRWSAQAHAQGATLVLADGEPVTGVAAEADLHRALDVLVENALAYGGPGVTVTLRARPGAVEVLDDGPGPEPGEEDEVFDRFHRGSAARAGGSRTPGTGLGLAIARELAQRWGGAASLRRGPAGGAVATLEVPS
ncbi:sensor histidine kinase [Paraconexibacter algicola]|uniref:histidine kinase n=1 Tax=Paraconexibacter algicola TaxID=2133960 RepID=A0A2T4UMY1_9ACTN|nr:ATP-binding protein [Paraconexibacter algicola]PTL60578.1 two-component sensor histidine kinase [Paraconexibacter algicola]